MATRLGSKADIIICVLFGFSVFTCLIHIVSFSVDYWYYSDVKLGRQFVRIGLHRICFNNFYHAQNDNDYYNGCHEFISDRLRDLKAEIMLDWFNTVRTLAIVNVPFTACIMFINILAFVFVMGEKCRRNTPDRSRFYQIVLVILSISYLAAAILTLVTLATFYAHHKDRPWLPNKFQWEGHLLGYGFFLQCVNCALLIMAFILAVIGLVFKSIAIAETRSTLYSEDMALSASGKSASF